MVNKKFDPLGDSLSELILLAKYGSDQDIVSAARVSYDGESKGGEADKKLLLYLWNHEHRSCFRMASVKFYVKAPLFVMREWYRHNFAQYEDAQDSWNEMSARYTVMKDEFYVLPHRVQDLKNKQGSLEKEVSEYDKVMGSLLQDRLNKQAIANRDDLLKLGYAKELANRVLPQTIYSKFIWQINLDALLNFIKLRSAPNAQVEIKKYSDIILNEVIKNEFPWCYEAYMMKKD